MCGIAGLIHKGKSSNIGGEVTSMLQALKHRGPDSTGFAIYGEPNAGDYIMRFKVDDILDTHDVHNEDWFELFSEMPELSWGTAGEYGKIYLSSGLVFVSSLFIWRGVWAGWMWLLMVGLV